MTEVSKNKNKKENTNMKHTVLMRLFMLMLALCMLVGTFAACSTEDETDGTETDASTEAPGVTEETEDEPLSRQVQTHSLR